MKTISETSGYLTIDEGKLAALLVSRLKCRQTREGTVMTLDLRHRQFHGLGRITMYRPGGTGWPDAGQTTDDEGIAEKWILQRGGYAQYLHRQMLTEGGIADRVSVADAGRNYIAHLHDLHGPRHNTYINRKSSINAHISPAFGDTPLMALSRPAVRRFLARLTTIKEGRRVAAAQRTKENTYQTLLAIWRFVYEDDGCPFAGISLSAMKSSKEQRARIIAGEIDGVVPDRTYDADQILTLFLTAMWWDAHVLKRPNQAPRYRPFTAEVLAIGFGTGQRIAEGMRWRWKHLLMDEEVAFVPGTKNANAWRLIPLQRSLLPWLAEIRCKVEASGRIVQSTDHVLQMRPGEENEELSDSKTMIRRVGEVMRMAGLKIPGKATHACRATHATIGGLQSVLVDLPSLQTYLGHEAHGGGATEVYMNRSHLNLVIAAMPAAHRELIKLPTPSEVAALLPDFVPPGMKTGGFTMLKEWRAANRPGG